MPKQHITIRLPQTLIEWINAQADKEHRSRTNYIEKLLLERKQETK